MHGVSNIKVSNLLVLCILHIRALCLPAYV